VRVKAAMVTALSIMEVKTIIPLDITLRDVLCVRVSTAQHSAAIQRVRSADLISPVLAIMQVAKAAISPVSPAMEAISPVPAIMQVKKAVISPVSPAREAISPVPAIMQAAKDTPPKGEIEGASVPAQAVIIVLLVQATLLRVEDPVCAPAQAVTIRMPSTA
jgi:hypothetical protein